MPLRDKSRLWRVCRIAFRRVRITMWLVLLAVLGALLYVNQVGLPGFVKRPLLQKLRARGVDLQFSRIRWRWDHGIVAENVRFEGTDPSISPRLTIEEVEVQLDYRALARLQLQVGSLVLHEGRLTMPTSDTNGAAGSLTISNIQSELWLLPGDVWKLSGFSAQFGGGSMQLTGSITNASAIRKWKVFQPREHAPTEELLRRARRWAGLIAQVHFESPPQLVLDVRGDALDLQSFVVKGGIEAPDAETPWGNFDRGRARVRLSPAAGSEWSHAEITLKAGRAKTRWGGLTGLNLRLNLTAPAKTTNEVVADLKLSADVLETQWGAASGADFAFQWVQSFTNSLPRSGHGQVTAAQVQSKWGGATNLQVSGSFSRASEPSPRALPGGAWWTRLEPYALDWKCAANGLRTPTLQADDVASRGQWRAPLLEAGSIDARLYGGRLHAKASLDVPSRMLAFTGSSDFDVQKLSPLLTEKSRHWLSQYTWEKPPVIQAMGSVVLPEWTNRHPDWRLDVKPSVQLHGHFRLEDATFRAVPITSAQGHFNYSNEVWELPDIVATRPEGSVAFSHRADERTRNYYFKVRSTIDLNALRPLFTPRQQRAFDQVTFSRPPMIDGEIWGRWYELERIGINARVAVTNFSVRDQSADSLEAAMQYTNGFLSVTGPRIIRGGGAQHMTATAATVDFSSETISVTNGFSTAEPLVVARAIGPRIGTILEPYRFMIPPTVRVNGIIPMHDESKADLHFSMDSSPLEWWRFRTPRIQGKVDWVGRRLLLRDLRAEFYGGTGSGDAEFDFQTNRSADFSFVANVSGADLHQLMVDLSSRSNRLEGILGGRLDVTHANSRDWQSWQGAGRVSIRDGLIWEIPIFGIFSPVLDTLVPGLGSSRASEGSASFNITNGVIHSDDLEIRASIMRLRYWGAVDLKERVNAQAEAELLRDTWVLGRFLSLALWPVSKLFQYEITGTLHEPKSEPLFLLPRLMLLPFHPIRTLRDLAPQPEIPTTNGPPALGD
ncbi:MAG TPA: AsmA-like C-terminal region-containing protein [Verrucomicrobiae bacterium]|nr:AsmA-like C-terminal region-containing protein [Verrucomicrobiae bacterium]